MHNNKLSALVVATLLLCSTGAHADTIVSKDSTGSVINSQLTIAGTSYSVDWYLPNANASGLVTVQHGFSRGCGNLRDTSKRIMANGLMVLCVNANMSGGNPSLAEALADTLVNGNITTPDGRVMPSKSPWVAIQPEGTLHPAWAGRSSKSHLPAWLARSCLTQSPRKALQTT